MRKSEQQSQQHISKHKVFLVRIIWLRCLESREASTVTHKTVLCGGKLWGSKVPRRFFVRQMQAIYGHVLRTPPFKELCHTGRILFTRKTEFMVLCIKGVLKKVLKLINSVLAYSQIFLVATSFLFKLARVTLPKMILLLWIASPYFDKKIWLLCNGIAITYCWVVY